MGGIIQAVAKWYGHGSSILLATGGNGVKAFTDMQLGHQLWLCGSEVPGKHLPPMAPEVLLSELPPDPSKSWPLAALATYQQQVQAIKDLCQRHRGEVREISGEWTQIDRPFPEPATGGIHFFHAQFCLSAEGQRALTLLQLAGARGGSWQAALANTFLQPAPGGDPRKHMLRQARVFALPELFAELGGGVHGEGDLRVLLGGTDHCAQACAWPRVAGPTRGRT